MTLPILQPSHWPQHRHQERKRPLRLHNKREHDAMVQYLLKDDPDFFNCVDPPPLPYGVWLMKDGTDVLFDAEYRPIWKRRGEGYRATRADPAEYFDWIKVLWMYDDSLLPEDSEHLREILALVVEEFCAGRSLWVRRWKPKSEPKYAGVLISRHPAKPSNVTPLFPN
ncbi:hypothetical protein [Bradyrhizobium erythrophlei]|uniref:Uncharacterized protein n=1 Tax=Bradyrhizobium erythrophlei TaxID=1437360 RepID=A0A1M5I929_9BRAD|nr:hypothetical protein [Bradyrhizobium erythrophlei]SHG24796.1 hypothetical protein SAMN05444169_1389 [Bradyrhizobium erythrophlei]